jgi:hypothetical protein
MRPPTALPLLGTSRVEIETISYCLLIRLAGLRWRYSNRLHNVRYSLHEIGMDRKDIVAIIASSLVSRETAYLSELCPTAACLLLPN